MQKFIFSPHTPQFCIIHSIANTRIPVQTPSSRRAKPRFRSSCIPIRQNLCNQSKSEKVVVAVTPSLYV